MIKLALFLITALCLVVAGATFEIGGNVSDVWQAPELLAPGLTYAGAVLLVLILRAVAYAIVGRAHRVPWSAPYFVPVPNLFGTLGGMHYVHEAPSRKALFDMAAAAALTGLVVSVVCVALGLHWSDALDSAQAASPSLAFGQPLLFQWILQVVKPDALESGAAWHPLAFAGWTGLLVTSVALLPLGQLDGGHIAYAVFGRRQGLVASGALAVLVGIGLAQQAPLWVVWVLIMLLIGHRHPGSVTSEEPVGRARMLASVLLLVIVLVCFTVQPTGGWTRHA